MYKKRSIVTGIIVTFVLLGIALTIRDNPTEGITAERVDTTNLVRTVLATGQVTTQVDLSLSFKTSGTVRNVFVKVGQQVKEGDVLASLDQRDQQASIISARGVLASAQANLKKVLEGASTEEVLAARSVVDSSLVSLENSKKVLEDTKGQQDILVANAKRAMLNSALSAVPRADNIGVAPVISGTYTGDAEGVYSISFYSSGGSFYYSVSGLESSGGVPVNAGVLVPVGTKGIYATFPEVNYSSDVWIVEIPNTKATSYIANLNAYNASLETRRVAITSAENTMASSQASLDQSIAQLNLKQAQARPADVENAQAQILSARGQLMSAEALFENTIIRAPVAGTVTKVDVKVGEQATALTPLVFLQDVDNLYVEGLVSEANIALVATGQKVTYTFDALGLTKEFSGLVTAIDPASTVVSGVVNYKVTSNIEGVVPANGVQSATGDSGLKILPGMTANMSVKVAEKQGVLAVPQRSLIEKNGKDYVRVVTNKEKGVFEERPVTLGLEADGGVVEILSGLSQGEEIVTFIEETK